MTDALVNDKPQFVRLFTENGLNILEYLTYERLESLYQSLSSSTLAYTLLQSWLRDRQNMAFSQTCSPDTDGNCKDLKSAVSRPSSTLRLSLFEVGVTFTQQIILHMLWFFILNAFFVFQVSRLLGEIFGGMCKPFYYIPLGLESRSSTRRTVKVPSPTCSNMILLYNPVQSHFSVTMTTISNI